MESKISSNKPEEIVRQKLLADMIHRLGYPSSFLSVEKDLSELSHFRQKQSPKIHNPKRRIDVLCFAKGIHPEHTLYPLLLIECKAVPLGKKVISQVEGYNYLVGAFFWAICNQTEFHLFWMDAASGKKMSLDFLPTYKALIQSI